VSEDKDKFNAAVKFIRRTGAKSVDIRYSDDEDPTVWFVVAKFDGSNVTGIEGVEVDAGFSPLRAILRLCERLADGGLCRHCERRLGLVTDTLARMPMDDVICWYQYDPELKVFRRGCE